MANKTIKTAVAAGVLAALTAGNTMASTLTSDALQLVGSEFTSKDGGVSVALDSSVALQVGVSATKNYISGDIVKFTITNGKFAAGVYQLTDLSLQTQDDKGKVGATLLQGDEGGNVVSFRMTSEGFTSQNLALSSGSVAPAIVLDTLASDAAVTIAYEVTQFGEIIDSGNATTWFTGAQQFTAKNTDADATISLEEQRLKFSTGKLTTSDGTITVENNTTVAALPATHRIALNGDDKVNLTLTGDMTGIDGISIGTKSFTIAGSTATLTVDADDAVASGALTVDFAVDGETELEARDFTVTTVLNLNDEDTQTLENSADFGTWSVNSLEAIVSNMVLQSSGFVSWLKVSNEGPVASDINAVVTWSKTEDGEVTSGQTSSVKLGEIAGKSIVTISQRDVLEAIGMDSAAGSIEATIHVTISAPADDIQIVSEKKAPDGRVTSPVVYKGTGRNFGL